MAGKLNSKLKLLYLKDIFEKYSDEQHILNAVDLVYRLNNEYGLECERKSIYKDIDVLIDYGMDIIRTRTPKNGYFLASGKFELAEIRLLSDAVQAADFITKEKTRKLVDKIEGLTSMYQASVLKKQVYIDNRTKSSNETVYYTINDLDTAIKTGCKVKLDYSKRRLDEKYAARKETRTHVLSPYSLIWSDDHYYLVANNEKYDNLMHLRIDRISNVEILPDKVRKMEEVCAYKNYFDAADYASRQFHMFSGKPETVELRCKNKILEQMLDRFGEKVFTRQCDEECFFLRTEAAVNQGLVAWILQYGDDMEVTSPQNLRDMVKETAERIAAVYGTKEK